MIAFRLIEFRVGTLLPTATASETSELPRAEMSTEETLASNRHVRVAEAHLTPPAKEADETMEPVADNAPVPEISINDATNSASAASSCTAVLQKVNTLPFSEPHAATDAAQQSVPSPTGNEPLDAAHLPTPQPSPLKDSPLTADKEKVTQLPMPPPTSPDKTTAKDGHDTEYLNLQQSNILTTLGDKAPTKTHRQSTPLQDGLDATKANEQLNGVNTTLPVEISSTLPVSTDNAPVRPPKQSRDDRSTTDALKTHIGGLTEPDIDSLLELIRKDDGFDKESKPQRDKLAEAIMAVRDVSQSKEWSNLLRGIIILTVCLEFPKGDVSEIRT